MALLTNLLPEDVRIGSNMVPRWSLRAAATAFDIPVETLRRRLIASEEEADSEDTFTTGQILRAVFSDERSQRLRRTKAEADLLELKAQILKCEYLAKPALTDALQSIVVAITQIIDGSKLSSSEKSEIRQNLASIPVVLEQHAKQQSKIAVAEEITNPVKKRGRPRKAAVEDE